MRNDARAAAGSSGLMRGSSLARSSWPEANETTVSSHATRLPCAIIFINLLPSFAHEVLRCRDGAARPRPGLPFAPRLPGDEPPPRHVGPPPRPVGPPRPPEP